MSRMFIDVNVPMYAAGTTHPLQKPAQRVIMAIATGEVDAVTDAEVFQEILYRYLSIGQRAKGFEVFDNFHRIMLGRVLPVEEVDVVRARDLADQYAALSPRDLIHLAVMLRHQIPDVITTDRGFDGIAGVRHIDPFQFLP